MTIYNWLCLLGVPAILAAAFKLFTQKLKLINKRQEATELGLQALLRQAMLDSYFTWKREEKVPIHIKDSFENMWTQYEALGANGVMTDIHNEFMALPNE